MKEITKEVLKDAANRLMFDMSEGEYDTLLEEFKVLTKQMETIGKISGLESYEPMTFPFDCHTDILRDLTPARSPMGRSSCRRWWDDGIHR